MEMTTFPLAEIGDGETDFYLKMYSKCCPLLYFYWIHQEAVTHRILASKGVTPGRDFCRIQTLRNFIKVIVVRVKMLFFFAPVENLN